MDAAFALEVLCPADFCARVTPLLVEREAENNLPIGLARRMARYPEAALDGLLLGVRSGEAFVAAAAWTPPHDLIVTRLPPGAASVIADHLVARPARPEGVIGPEAFGRELAECLAARAGGAVELRGRQLVYELTTVSELPAAPGSVRAAAEADHDLLREWYAAFVRDAHMPHGGDPCAWARSAVAGGNTFLWDDGGPRSLACCSRHTPHGRSIGPVYTPPEARRRGYATSLVAELSRRELALGKRFVCLFTDAANPTSNHIYQSIGFRVICSYDAYRVVLG